MYVSVYNEVQLVTLGTWPSPQSVAPMLTVGQMPLPLNSNSASTTTVIHPLQGNFGGAPVDNRPLGMVG